MSAAVIYDEKQLYVKDFEALQEKDAPYWLSQLRQNAMNSFLSLQFPTSKDEDWRFTNVAPILKAGFQSSQRSVVLGMQEIEPFLFDKDATSRLVFVNGRFSNELSWMDGLDGVRAGSISNLNESLLSEHLCRYARFDKNIFTALNTAFIQDAACVFVPDGLVVERPIHILFVSAPKNDEIYHPRILVVTGKGSVANIIESHVCRDKKSYFSNSVVEILLGDGSILEHYKFQNESENSFHIASTYVEQQRDSSYASFSMTLGAELSRNEMNIRLNGVGANCALNGLYLTDGIQHVDNQTLIDHARPHGTSYQMYKGILNGKSRAVFNGKIIVQKDAQKTDARQVNKNLLLSDGARVNTKPQLEILEEDALFYLKSRGMSDQNARSLLMYGFINDVLLNMKTDVVRDKLTEVIMSRLAEFGSAKGEAS
jgi:Fe-S cluster assembly protein SufD